MVGIDHRRIAGLYLAGKQFRLIASLPNIFIEKRLVLCLHTPTQQASYSKN
jgi:hypothetical protein